MLCLAGIGFVKGLFDGIIKQVVSLIALFVAIFFCSQVALWLKVHIAALQLFPAGGVSTISYVAAFLLIVGVVLLAGEVVSRIVGVTPLSVLNHLAGGVLGLFFMLGFVSLLLNGIEEIDRNSSLISRQAKVESKFYQPIVQIIPTIYFDRLFFKR